MNRTFWAVLAIGLLSTVAPALTTQTAPAQKRQPGPRAASVRISVRDEAGTAISDVHLSVSGAAAGDYTTGAAGTAIVPNLKPGAYRIRAERDGYITLEREFTLGSGVWNPVDLVLNTAPPPPPKPAPEPVAVAPAPSGGAPLAVSIPDFLEHNFIGRDPIKESVLACNPLETVRLLQFREALAPHVHDRLDEIIYVVAGEGVARIADEDTPLRPGMVVVVPSASRHAFERRGKNPLVVVSTLAGAACEAPH
jgi:hypothetical protein